MAKLKLLDKNIGYNPTIFCKATASKMNASETVYKNVAIDKALKIVGLENVDPETELEIFLAKRADGKMAIDHFVRDGDGTIASLQTRFRGDYYKNYDDFTIRYDKPSDISYTGGNVLCEYYHFNADLMLYGICNEDVDKHAEKVTDFIKWVLVDVAKFRKLCREGKIVIDETLMRTSKKSTDGTKLICGIGSNKGDKDTRFVVVNVKLCKEMFPDLILAQKGFFKP